MRYAAVVLSFCLFSVACFGFKPCIHKEISRKAVEIYTIDYGESAKKWADSGYLNAFIKGSVAEDNFFTLDLQRLRNWHFYDHQKGLGTCRKGGILCACSNRKRFYTCYQALRPLTGCPKKDIEALKTLGRMAHHIQDMSSPPHVMPIYHTAWDAFDGFIPHPKIEKDFHKLKCALMENPLHPLLLLDRAAQDTLHAVQRPIKPLQGQEDSRETWLRFWGGDPDPRYPGFRRYGVYGNAFGAIPPCAGSRGKSYTQETYNAFFNERLEEAVTNTLRLLIWLQQNQKAPQGGKTPSLP